MSREHRNFNSKLYHTRRSIDLAYELLRARWKRLKCLEMDEVKSMVNLVKSCCILHNICINNEGYVDRKYEKENKEDVEVEYNGPQSMSAQQKRDMLATYLSGEPITLNIQ